MTQKNKILGYMEQFGKITPIEAFTELGCTKLSTRISELRRCGYNIIGEWTEGNDTRYMTYHIEEVET